MKVYEHPANKEREEVLCYLSDKRESGQISSKEHGAIMRAGIKVLDDAGIPDGPEANPMTIAVYRQMLHTIKLKIVEIHPELADEVRNLGSRSR